MKKEDVNEASSMMQWLGGMALGIIILAMLFGCTRTAYEPVESVRTEYRDRDVERIITDTVNNTRVVFIKGDTIVDYREREHIRTVQIHDTCLIERNDTIRIPYPVERQLSRWEQAKMDFGGISIGVALCIIAIAVVWLIRAMRR